MIILKFPTTYGNLDTKIQAHMITPVIILGGIYAGFFTPSESAAVAGVYAVLIGFLIYKELTLSSLEANSGRLSRNPSGKS